jgi:2-polyprenyl-6-methoxyphenol hydroxylase-like FAD-dependent oxidoreductase
MQTRQGCAIVIGASIAGLTAARALSDSFEKVIVLDRDDLPGEPALRVGVPQGRQVHGLLAGGQEVFEELFPGFTGELAARGALHGDVQADFHWYFDGRLLKPTHSGMTGVGASRVLLEHRLRARVGALPGVTIHGRAAVTGLCTDRRRTRVTGVRVQHGQGRDEAVLEGDLVVDASGRGSRTPVWFAELGYPRAEEEEVRSNITYVSRLYRREPRFIGGRLLGVSVAAYPGQLRSGFVLAQEGNRLIVSVGGWAGEQPPLDAADMASYADGLACAEVAEVIRHGEPLGEAVKMRFPASVRRHYERLERTPLGYLVMGDALCSFNPLFGQGMSVAAYQGQALRALLRDGREGIERTFSEAASKIVGSSWGLAVSAEFRFPQVEGTRTSAMEEAARYAHALRMAATEDAELATAFLRVTNMVDEPARLYEPDMRGRVLAQSEGDPLLRAAQSGH